MSVSTMTGSASVSALASITTIVRGGGCNGTAMKTARRRRTHRTGAHREMVLSRQPVRPQMTKPNAFIVPWMLAMSGMLSAGTS